MNLFLQDVECKYESLLTYTANMAYDFLQCMYESVAKYPHLPGMVESTRYVCID